MRSHIGWSLPPGVKTLPGEEPDPPCEVCGNYWEDCICPECPICWGVGDPDCYRGHGLKRSEEQKFSLEVNEREWKEENDSYYKTHVKINTCERCLEKPLSRDYWSAMEGLCDDCFKGLKI